MLNCLFTGHTTMSTNKTLVVESPICAKYTMKFWFVAGCAVLIGAETQKVIDIDPRCKSCIMCKRKLQHETCYRNHVGSSGSMEAAGMVQMFNRSLNSSLRYKTYIGDRGLLWCSDREGGLHQPQSEGNFVINSECNGRHKLTYLMCSTSIPWCVYAHGDKIAIKINVDN